MDGNMYYYMQFGDNNDRKVSFLDKVGGKTTKNSKYTLEINYEKLFYSFKKL